ncbi:MAG: hypothetical protein WCE50_09310, partial [Candidatus Acidiferrum sp.]
SRSIVFERVWKAAHAAAGLDAPIMQAPRTPAAAIPFLSEPWYCCAEPTREQFVSIGQVAKKPEEPLAVSGSHV